MLRFACYFRMNISLSTQGDCRSDTVQAQLETLDISYRTFSRKGIILLHTRGLKKQNFLDSRRETRDILQNPDLHIWFCAQGASPNPFFQLFAG